MSEIATQHPCPRTLWRRYPWASLDRKGPLPEPFQAAVTARQLVTRCDSERHAELVVGASLELGIDPLSLLDALDRLEVASAIDAWKGQPDSRLADFKTYNPLKTR